MWDTGKEDETLVASSGIGDDSHREPISKLQWVKDTDSKSNKYNVSRIAISTGIDCVSSIITVTDYLDVRFYFRLLVSVEMEGC